MSILFSHFFQKFNQITPLETDFTEVLGSIAHKPKMLYFYGKMPKNMLIGGFTKRPKCVAIVGTRHNSRYGEEVAYKMAFELAKRDVVIVSGLAFGIDAIAHQAALDAGGRTVAVLGTPINQIYPRAHEGLAREIVEKGGVVMSEYPPEAVVYPKTSFLERNRLIAGLADVVVVVEAAEKSGSINTAGHALNQGKEVFAVPGNITNPLSVGTNRLLRQGAIPYTRVEDILEVLFPEDAKRKRATHQARQTVIFGDTAEETAILQALYAGECEGEKIMERLGMSAAVFAETMTMLEIKGLVKSLGANRWIIS